jgi:hypothetical protein
MRLANINVTAHAGNFEYGRKKLVMSTGEARNI